MKHPLLNKIKIPTILMVGTLMIAVMDILGSLYGITTFGEIVKTFYPCTKEFFPADDTGCHIGYDIILFYLLTGIFILSLITAAAKTVIYFRSNKKL